MKYPIYHCEVIMECYNSVTLPKLEAELKRLAKANKLTRDKKKNLEDRIALGITTVKFDTACALDGDKLLNVSKYSSRLPLKKDGTFRVKSVKKLKYLSDTVDYSYT